MRVSVVIALLLAAETVSAGIDADRKALDERFQWVRTLCDTAPGQFVPQSLKLADDYLQLAARDQSDHSSRSLRFTAELIILQAASFTRFQLKEPLKAIDLYNRAAGIHGLDFPSARFGYRDQVADIYEFDLHDRDAAVNLFEQLGARYRDLPSTAHVLDQWRRHAIEVEIEFLRSRKRFAGDVTATEAEGFLLYLAYIGGMETLSAGIDHPVPLAGPPSHGRFMATWSEARTLSKDAVEAWLERNDPAGFWRASLLTRTAIADRQYSSPNPPREDASAALLHQPSGQPSGFVLAARDYAKTHVIPAALPDPFRR